MKYNGVSVNFDTMEALYARIAELEKRLDSHKRHTLDFFESMPNLSDHTEDLLCNGWRYKDDDGWVYNKDDDECADLKNSDDESDEESSDEESSDEPVKVKGRSYGV